jgi:hypothetical protein
MSGFPALFLWLKDKREESHEDTFFDKELRKIASVRTSQITSNTMYSPKSPVPTHPLHGPLQSINTIVSDKPVFGLHNDIIPNISPDSLKKKENWICMSCGHIQFGYGKKCVTCQSQDLKKYDLEYLKKNL